MSIKIELTGPKSHLNNIIYTSDDKVSGLVRVEPSTYKGLTAIDLRFIARLQVDISLPDPAANKGNTVQQTLFQQKKRLWQANAQSSNLRSHSFEMTFPADVDLLPSYTGVEILSAGFVGKTIIEYFLEVQTVSPSIALQTATRRNFKFVPREARHESVSPGSKINFRFDLQLPQTHQMQDSSSDHRGSFFGRLKSISLDSSRRKVHFELSYIYPMKAYLDQPLPFSLKTAHHPSQPNAAQIPRLFLKSLRIGLLVKQSLTANSASNGSNGLPEKWSCALRLPNLVNWTASNWQNMLPMYVATALRMRSKGLTILLA